MNTSIFVVQIAAVIYLSVGVGMLINPDYYQRLFAEVSKDSLAMYVGGFMALILGFTLVTYHNIWVQGWQVLVTIIGWLALIKGFLILAFPRVMQRLTKSMLKTKNTSSLSVFVILLGLIFMYFGFIA